MPRRGGPGSADPHGQGGEAYSGEPLPAAARGPKRSPRRLFSRAHGLALIPLLIVSCASVWNLGNQRALEADVLEVLRPAPDQTLSLKCRMIATTRSGYCLGEISEMEAGARAQALDLESFRVDLEDAASVPPLAAEGPVGCLSAEVFPGVDGLPAYWVGGRPVQLGLGSGAQFEYLLLIVDPATDRGCVQVSYAYG